MVSDGIADDGFAHPRWGMQAIEGVSHFAAACVLAHECLETQDFLHDPVGFLAGQRCRDVSGRWIRSGATCEALGLFPAEGIGQISQGEEGQYPDQQQEPNEHGQKGAEDKRGGLLMKSLGLLDAL